MSFSKEIREKIRRFAEEQSQHYLEEAEMTYLKQGHSQAGQAEEPLGDCSGSAKRYDSLYERLHE